MTACWTCAAPIDFDHWGGVEGKRPVDRDTRTPHHCPPGFGRPTRLDCQACRLPVEHRDGRTYDLDLGTEHKWTCLAGKGNER